jgi:SAM-dependent methyltransferase
MVSAVEAKINALVTWEETILWARTQKEMKPLLHDAYLSEDVIENARRYSDSAEFLEVLQLVQHHSPKAKQIADVGAGNGVASYAFAKAGYEVFAIEPDPGIHTGRAAIQQLTEHGQPGIRIFDGSGEHIPLADQSVDVVFVRQALHHAANLRLFVTECHRILRKGGILFSLRDHVVDHPAGLQEFLQSHPLHKYYQGENAYTELEYREAIQRTGFQIELTLQHYDNVINYAPEHSAWLEEHRVLSSDHLLAAKLGSISAFPGALFLYRWYVRNRYGYRPPVSVAQGRHIAFIARK